MKARWVMVVGALLWVTPAAAQRGIVEQGNQAYQAGDYAAAVSAYEAVLSAGFESADLHYNLGNAYFKSGDLGRAILEWERAERLAPTDSDIEANLELARSLTADAIEPMPRFWLFSLADWWIELLPRMVLIGFVILAWLAVGAGSMLRILSRDDRPRRVGAWIAVCGGVLLLLLGPNFMVREMGLGRAERAVILFDTVPVRSAPLAEDDLTVFEIHEGTRVRVDRRSGDWAEVVLDDGKVGWVPVEVMETI